MFVTELLDCVITELYYLFSNTYVTAVSSAIFILLTVFI